MLLCSSCGSRGIHIGCGRLDWSTMEWDCEDCNLKSHNRNSPKVGSSAITPLINPVNITSRSFKRPHPLDNVRNSNSSSSSSVNSTNSSISSDSDSDVDVESLDDTESPFSSSLSQSIQSLPINYQFKLNCQHHKFERITGILLYACQGSGGAPASRNVARRGRGSFSCSRPTRSKRHTCNFDNLSFKVVNNDTQIIVSDRFG